MKKIKDLDGDRSLLGLKFKHPKTNEICIWKSQWGDKDGKAGVFFHKPGDQPPGRVYPIFLNKLEEAMEFELPETED